MSNYLRNKTIKIFGLLAIFLVSTSGSCGSGSGSRGGEGVNKQTLTFSKVNLHYNFSNYGDKWTSYADDYSELAYYHGIDAAKKIGRISSLYEIVRYQHEIKDNERKPEIKFTFNKVDNSLEELIFKPEQVGDNYLSEVPMYNDFNTLTLSIKSTVTEKNKLQLCWTKVFDMSILSWGQIDNSDLSEMAVMVSLPSYTKCVGRNDGLLVRPVDAGYKLAAYSDLSLNGGEQFILYSDDELILSSSTLNRPIYYGGELSSEMKWSEPLMLLVD